jgi:hypothetical protein
MRQPTYPGIADDYRSTFVEAKAMNPDVLLGPHSKVYGIQAKRARMKDGASNPFVKPGGPATHVAGWSGILISARQADGGAAEGELDAARMSEPQRGS